MRITAVHRITPPSSIDHDLVSVVKILLKAFCIISVSDVTKAEYGTRDDVTKAEYGTRDDVTFYTVYPSHKTYPCQNSGV
jgi:hypothetical protein